MRAYLIDPEKFDIIEIDYSGDFRDISPMIGDDCRAFDAARFNDQGDAVYVDDEGLLKNPTQFFEIEGYPAILAGRGVVVGCDMETGESQAPTVDMEWLEENVSFMVIREHGPP